ncbi:glycosyltransferase family 4 protein [Providencia rettgeri]|uniref:glycosyltransferase family 4 protein n=1 Tax=Providencia rettgeri TaxID=587 RepID=UPI001E54C7C4|nr:glycosyltransferase family 4 protein [Providencia rettgeri]UFK94535.1 glycosyltransferase family 4 protein [Providencia rettgeri]
MKILIISHEFPPAGGGAGTVARQYCDYLVALGHDITIISANIDNNEEKNICKIKPKKLKLLWPLSYYKNLRSLQVSEYDIVILNDVGATLVAGFFFKKVHLEKSIIVLHGQEPEQIYTNPTKIYNFLNLKKYYKRAIFHSKKIIAVSHYMKEKFINLALLNSEKEIIGNKIVVSYTGIASKIFSFTERKTYTQDGKVKLLTVSRIEKEKGFDDCVQLALKLRLNSINFEWIIIGEGPYLEKLRGIIAKENLTNQVKLIGRLPQEELSRYYKNADLFILFSHLTESFGLVYLEAQLCGCPAIGYNKFGVKESIIHNKTGFLVKNIEETFLIIKNEEYKKLTISPSDFNEFSFEQATMRLDRIINE